MSAALPQFDELVEHRVILLRQLAAGLESAQCDLVRNDAEAIARGAAHQAELCRQWSVLESELRLRSPNDHSSQGGRAADLQAEWEALQARIQHLTRVHRSLLRHLERSLIVLRQVVVSCAPTYTPDLESLPSAELRLRAGG